MYTCRVEEQDGGSRQQRGQWVHSEGERWRGGGVCLKSKKRRAQMSRWTEQHIMEEVRKEISEKQDRAEETSFKLG